MVRKNVLALSLASLALGLGGPAFATPTPKFLGEYGNIFGARPSLTTDEERPSNALQAARGEVDEPASRIVISPFFNTTDLGSIDVMQYGGGFSYTRPGGKNPWELSLGVFNTNVDVSSLGDVDCFSWAVGGKFVLWSGANANQPVVSIVGSFLDIQDAGNRWDVALAADQRLTNEIFLTANLGWAEVDPDLGRSVDDFVPGFGITYRPKNYSKLSLSFDYVVDNDVDGEDLWSISALYQLTNRIVVRAGGGKHDRFFVNLNWLMDR